MTGPRHALVTGTSSGIGAAVAARLLAEGWRVTGIARRPVTMASPHYTHVACDLSDAAARRQLITNLPAATAFVHAAGILATGGLDALDAERGRAMWDLHVAAAEEIAGALAPRMPEGGRIVLIGSRTWTGSPQRSQYAATKAALVAMARSWAAELVARGITVNVVAPAATETPMLGDPGRSGVPPRVPPMGRLIRPDEVAAAVTFLMSRDADAITGQVLTICGGASL
jgi:NAD(P)-dependent dehydrogenase (short-subunit alcohol dehydrogenase family)